MPDPTLTSQPLSPLLSILQKQIVPDIQRLGMSSIVVARPTWQAMQAEEDDLPPDASITHKPLKSKRIPIRGKRDYRSERATLDARWPEDGLHSNRAPILMFVVRGKVAIPLGDYVLRCRPGHGTLILPGTPHPDGSQLCLDDCERATGVCSMLSFKVMGEGIACWLNHTREGKHWSGGAIGEDCHIPNPQARVYLETLTEEAKNRPPHFRAMCDGLIKVLVTLLLREIQELRTYQPMQPRQTIFNPATPATLREHDPISRIEEYVQSHLHDNLSIDRMAAYAYMSRAHFTRQFRVATGKTFNQYVTECRLEAARVFLQNTDWTISGISNSVGVTPARLRKLFRQHENVTPTESRRRVRKDKTKFQ
jgi:two-component system response regulator YesN